MQEGVGVQEVAGSWEKGMDWETGPENHGTQQGRRLAYRPGRDIRQRPQRGDRHGGAAQWPQVGLPAHPSRVRAMAWSLCRCGWTEDRLQRGLLRAPGCAPRWREGQQQARVPSPAAGVCS